MAIFTRNKNPKALLGNQKLFKICCDDPAPDPCCYSTEAPRPPAPCQECGKSINVSYLVNNVPTFLSPIIIDTSMLPAVIEVLFENGNRECDATFGKITSDTPDPNINVITSSPGTIEPGVIKLVATIQLNTVLSPGSYSPFLFYTLCGIPNVLNVEILIESIVPPIP